MSEHTSTDRDMVIVFRSRRSIIVPPFELARDVYSITEGEDKAALRISKGFTSTPDIDDRIPVPNIEGAPDTAFLVESYHYLHRSEFLVHHSEISSTVDAHAYLSHLEKQLLISAANLLEKIR